MMNAEVRRAFIEAGVSEKTAEAAASSVGDLNQLATKTDLNKLEGELKDLEIRLVKWMIGQGGVIIAVVGLMIKFL